MDRVDIVEAALDDALAAAPQADTPRGPDEPIGHEGRLSAAEAVAAFEDQLTSRVLDVVARELKRQGHGYYTISSAGHEDNVALGALTRASDPALLHYRSGAFVLARARVAAGADGKERKAARTAQIRDVLHSLMATREDPVAEGRHKVWGSRERWIVPQTSTIGSHPPKAVGLAVALGRRQSLGLDPWPNAGADVPQDAVVVCSFGDASLNHASTLTALNAARWAHRRGSAVPLLLVCEDNGIGISTPTPSAWVERTVSSLPGLAYVRAEGEADEVFAATARAVDRARSGRRPVFLHLPTVRLWGHAGSDVEAGYRTREAIAADEARDPLVRTARQLLAEGAATREELTGMVARVRREVRDLAAELTGTPHLDTSASVVAPLAPHRPDEIRAEVAALHLDDQARREVHGRRLPEEASAPGERTLAAHLNGALHDQMLARPETVLFGQDVGVKGGVYGVTGGLQRAFGRQRVFDTLLDETSMLGLAQGFGLLGMLPVVEIQYLAYVHNALDQLRGEACSTSFFSAGAFTTPMVVRLPGLAYQKGFGGHFHNDDSVGALRDIPGLAIAVASRGDDAARLLRGALAMASTDGRVVAFVEPIALYHQRDLYEDDDGGWLSDHPPAGELLLPGEVGVYRPSVTSGDGAGDGAHGSGADARAPDPRGAATGDADEVLVVTYGNGVPMSLRAGRRLAADGIAVRVLDVRWLSPLPHERIAEHAAGCRAVVVADECRETGGGIADEVIARLAEAGSDRPVGSARSKDSYVPLGPAADTVLLGEDDIVAAVRRVVERAAGSAPRRNAMVERSGRMARTRRSSFRPFGPDHPLRRRFRRG